MATGENWRPLQTQIAEADHAYSTRFLHHMDERTGWLLRYRGNSITLQNSSANGTPTAWSLERPFASSRRASIIHLPYYVSPGLEAIRFSLYCRVSTHIYDDGGGNQTPDHVTVVCRLLGNQASTTRQIRPEWQGGINDGTPPDWAWHQFTLNVGQWQIDAEQGLWSWLVVEIQSSLYYDGSGTAGLILSDSFSFEDHKRISASTDADFYEEAGAAPYDSGEGANEVTCTVIRDAGGDQLGTWDHLKRRDNDTMWVWPRSVTDDPDASTVHKASMAYMQWRAITITEVYEDETGIDAYDKRPAVPSTARVPARTARRLNRANHRRQLVSGFHRGFLPESSSRWDLTKYRMRCPWVTGGDGDVEVYSQIGHVHGDAGELEFRPVVSPIYYAQAAMWQRRDFGSGNLGEAYSELQGKSVDAYLRLTANVEQLGVIEHKGGVIAGWLSIGTASIVHRTRYVFTDSSGASHHLLAVQKQFDTTDDDGDGFVYREGMLELSSDLTVLTSSYNNPSLTVELTGLDPLVPLRCRLSIEVIDPDDATYPGEFLDDDLMLQVVRSGNDPLHDHMHALLLGLSVWSDR